MSAEWPKVALNEILQPIERREDVVPGKVYRQIGVKLWGMGAYEREPLDGSQTRYKTLSSVEADDVIVNKIWARNGSVAVVTEDLAGCFGSNEFPTFAPFREKILPRWFHWFTKTPGFWSQCDEKSRGTSGKNRIRPERFLEIEIPLPSLDEQRRTVARIEELAAKIEEAQKLRRQAAEEAEALVISSLSNIFGYIFPDRLPDGWTWKSLSDLILNKNQGMTTGPFGTLLQKSEILENGVPILGIANVQANRFISGFVDYVSPQKADFLSSYWLESGDIVVARSGTVGRSCVVPDGLNPAPIMSTNLIRIRPNTNDFLPELLCMLLNGSRLVERHKDSECRGSSRNFFTQKILSKLQIPTPPIDEQRRIVARLDELQAQVDGLKRHQVRTAEELDALLPSVLDRAFRGQL